MNTGVSIAYSMDTSAFIDGLNRYYPIENFPALWNNFDALVRTNRIIAHRTVWAELNPETEERSEAEEEPEDPVTIWLGTDSRMDLFIDTNLEIADQVHDINERYPNWQDRGLNGADPYVVATAKSNGATVVTGEIGGSEKRPKIPYVCHELGVPCINFTELIKTEGWVF